MELKSNKLWSSTPMDWKSRVGGVEMDKSGGGPWSGQDITHLHQLGPNVIMNITVLPLAYSYGKNNNFSWEYCLVNIVVIGKCKDGLLVSPSKMIVKCKAVPFNFDSNNEDRPPSKKNSGSGAGAGGSGTGKNGGPALTR
ncbi:hypothetical protein B0H14DRAFT_2635939 [Mycena olivaceomarginata]|nr:hypothetical protein B0H14DRAFT_2635939 [Mycena olivaceomarginata]